MSDEHDQGDDLPNDPFVPHDAERIAKEAGGVIVAALHRANQERLTIGAFEHPHKLPSLNSVSIRMYLDGKRTDGIDLGLNEVLDMIEALRQAVVICWPPPPRAPDGT